MLTVLATAEGVAGCVVNTQSPTPTTVTVGGRMGAPSTSSAATGATALSGIPGDGTFRIGADIPPGTYRSVGSGSCYWARLSGLGGNSSEIIANSAADGPQVVQIAPTDVAFKTQGCADWERVSGPSASPTSTGVVAPQPTDADLGVGIPLSHPACDGSGVVILGSAVTPGRYDADVRNFLARFPAASYLRTDQSCSSLRQATEQGNPIYAVYQPAGKTQADICAAVRQAGGNAYGKWLDQVTDPGYIIPC